MILNYTKFGEEHTLSFLWLESQSLNLTWELKLFNHNDGVINAPVAQLLWRQCSQAVAYIHISKHGATLSFIWSYVFIYNAIVTLIL